MAHHSVQNVTPTHRGAYSKSQQQHFRDHVSHEQQNGTAVMLAPNALNDHFGTEHCRDIAVVGGLSLTQIPSRRGTVGLS